MPVVYPEPKPQLKWYENLGAMQGKVAQMLLSAYLQQGGGVGRVPTSPTPGNQGTLTFPSGASTRISPSELSQIQQQGGVPTRTGLLPSNQFSYAPPTRLGFLPPGQANILDQQLKQAQIDEAKANASWKGSLAGMVPPFSTTPTTPSTPTNTPTGIAPTGFLGNLWQGVQQGDQKSLDALRILAFEKGDQGAIDLLEQLGEL